VAYPRRTHLKNKKGAYFVKVQHRRIRLATSQKRNDLTKWRKHTKKKNWLILDGSAQAHVMQKQLAMSDGISLREVNRSRPIR
jgi:mannose-6-phosphate isomerase-like protein (cupin superfamily)